MQTVDNNNNNNSSTFKMGANLAGLVGGAAIGGSAAKNYLRYKLDERNLEDIEHRYSGGFHNYNTNKYLEHKNALDALDRKKMSEAEYNAKVKEHTDGMIKYRTAANSSNHLGEFEDWAYEDTEKGKPDAMPIDKARAQHQSIIDEYNQEKAKYVDKLKNSIEHNLGASKIKAGGALATVAAGLALPYLASKASERNSQQLNKTSSIFSGPEDEMSDDEKDKIQTYTAQNKSSFLPAMGLGMLAGGVGAERLGDKLIKEQKINENRMKQHAADADQHARNIQKIDERMNEIGRDGDEYEKLTSKRSALMEEFNKSRAKMLHATIAAGLNNGNHLKSIAPTLKWGALPIGIVGGYQLLSRRTNPDNPGLIKDPDTASKIHTVGTLSMIAGLGLIGKGMYRPLIKPVGNSAKKLEELRSEGKTGEEAFNEYMKNKTEFGDKHMDILSMREREAGKDEIADKYNEALNKVKDSNVDTDAKYLASGSALLSAGVVGSRLFPDDNVLKNEEKEYNLAKQNKR